MSNSINCEHCNSVFKTKSALNNHVNKAKYCLVIQKKNNEEFQCSLCKKNLSTKQNLEVHKEKCEGKKEDSFKCEHCDKIISSKQNLEIHKRKCKKVSDKKEVFKCKDCKKILSTKQSLLSHVNCCFEKKEKEFNELKERTDKEFNDLKERTDKEFNELKELKEEADREMFEKDKLIVKINTQLENYKEQLEKQEENYKEQIRDLQNKLDKIANKAIDRPTTVTNTTTNNNLNIMSSIDFNNLDRIKDLIEDKLNVNHVVDGQKGIAQFLVDSFLKDDEGNLKYKCTDKSRNIFKFLNSDGEINKDVDASKLISHIVDGGIKVKSVEIAKEWYTEEGIIDITKYQIMHDPQQLILTIEDDSSGFRRELASRTII
jgi:hypothetical protein